MALLMIIAQARTKTTINGVIENQNSRSVMILSVSVQVFLIRAFLAAAFARMCGLCHMAAVRSRTGIVAQILPLWQRVLDQILLSGSFCVFCQPLLDRSCLFL